MLGLSTMGSMTIFMVGEDLPCAEREGDNCSEYPGFTSGVAFCVGEVLRRIVTSLSLWQDLYGKRSA